MVGVRRVQDEFEALGEQDQRAVTELLKACDMLPVLGLKLSREIGRENNLCLGESSRGGPFRSESCEKYSRCRLLYRGVW